MSENLHESEPEEDQSASPDEEKIRVFDELSPVAWTLLISAFVHLAFVIPVVLFATAPQLESFDFEWIGEFETLEGIGHGGESGAWAEIEEMPFPEEEEEEVEPVSEELPEPEPLVEEVPEPEPEPLVEELPEPEPEPAPIETQPIVVKEAPQKKEEEKPEALVEKRPPVEQDLRDPITRAERLPGLNKGGPSDLPDLRNYGPGNARVTMLVRIDRLRGTPYESNLKRVIEAVPDYRILLDSTGLDPIRELDSMFMATADPRYLHETFLAVRHSMDDETLKGVLASRFADPVPWNSYEGGMEARPLVPSGARYQDPRMLLLARPGLTIVGKQEWLGEISRPAGEDSELVKDLRQAGEPLPVLTMIDGLQQIERAAEGDDTLVLISAHGIYVMLPGVGTLSRFQTVRMSIANAAAPRLLIDLQFATPDQASRFAASCPRMAKQITDSIPGARFLGITGIVDKLGCKAEEQYVTVRGDFTAQDMTRILQLATPFIPRPPALMGLPAPPPPPAPAAAVEEDVEVEAQVEEVENVEDADEEGATPEESEVNEELPQNEP